MSRFAAGELVVLEKLFDTIVPPDQDPGGWDGGVGRLLAEHDGDFMSWAVGPLRAAVSALNSMSMLTHGCDFAGLADSQAATLVTRLHDSDPDMLDAIIRVGMEGYYGGTREPAGWQVTGYAGALKIVPTQVVEPEPPAAINPDDVAPGYDVVVIGAGAGGGVAAAELAEAGLRVLLVERSRPQRASELRGNHLQGKRMDAYQSVAGAGPNSPRVVEQPDGNRLTVPSEGAGLPWALNAMTLGGGTRLWQGMSWRFLREDFAMASTYGVPEDSTLIDWPFGYEELAPYYDRVEWELGVSGESNGPVGRSVPRGRDYPMPPLPDDASRIAFGAAAARLGWRTSAIPFAINSVPRAGRPACVRCPQCVGHACPVDAKNGTHNTFVPRALATGACDLLMSTMAVRIDHQRGTASAVHLLTEPAPGSDLPIRETVVRAHRVVVSAGAIETARLLILSGLGNKWVGRNHHTHGVAIAVAGHGPDVNELSGPGHSVTTLDFLHRGGAAWGGGVLFDLNADFPLGKARWGLRLAPTPYGPAHKSWMRDQPNLIGAMSMVQEVPHALSDVRVSGDVRDRLGVPVPLLRGRVHPATAEATAFMLAQARRWVHEIGGTDVVDVMIPGGVPGAEHSAGTARLGEDPRRSACDHTGRLHGSTNVFVADASLHPTNGGMNPGLTVMANAMRVARLMADAS